jgi:hypothetical protein
MVKDLKTKRQKIQQDLIFRYAALISLETAEIHLMNTKTMVWSTARLILRNVNREDFFKISNIRVFQPNQCHNGLYAWVYIVYSDKQCELFELKQKAKTVPDCFFQRVSLENPENCACSISDLFSNSVLDAKTSDFVCICKHNIVYEGCMNMQTLTLQWFEKFKIASDSGFSPRVHSVLYSISSKRGKTAYRLVYIIGGYAFPLTGGPTGKLFDLWLLNIDPNPGIVNVGTKDLMIHFTSQTHLVYLERGERLKDENDEKSDLTFKFYLFNKNDGARSEIKIKNRLNGNHLHYYILSVTPNIINMMSAPIGVLAVHSFVPRGTELIFFVEYTEQDDRKDKLQRFIFNSEHIEIHVESEDHQLVKIGAECKNAPEILNQKGSQYEIDRFHSNGTKPIEVFRRHQIAELDYVSIPR